jgi:hypothetical protein
MNRTEIGQLLVIASGFSPFVTAERVPVESWHLLLSETEYQPALTAVIDFYRTWDGKVPLTCSYILDATNIASRHTTKSIADDVRSARARRWVDENHPETEPLPYDIQKRLEEAREKMRRDPDAWMQRSVEPAA